jgi:hypothetical protein
MDIYSESKDSDADEPNTDNTGNVCAL